MFNKREVKTHLSIWRNLIYVLKSHVWRTYYHWGINGNTWPMVWLGGVCVGGSSWKGSGGPPERTPPLNGESPGLQARLSGPVGKERPERTLESQATLAGRPICQGQRAGRGSHPPEAWQRGLVFLLIPCPRPFHNQRLPPLPLNPPAASESFSIQHSGRYCAPWKWPYEINLRAKPWR